MRLTLEEALESPLSWQEELVVPLEEFERSDLLEMSPIGTQGELRAVEGGYLLTGKVEYRQSFACTRCLEPAAEDVRTSFEVFLVPGDTDSADEDSADAEALELDADDLNVTSVVGGVIDTADFALEQVMLFLPEKALCRQDCKGLCPRCGENRNDEGACVCEPVGDPRWGALAGLKSQLDEQN